MDTETNYFLYRYAIIVPTLSNVINDQGDALKCLVSHKKHLLNILESNTCLDKWGHQTSISMDNVNDFLLAIV